MSFLEVTAQLANGFVTTLLIFGVTLVGAIPLGLLITLGSMSKIPPVKWIFKIFVWIIRGTPLMLQIILVFYGPGLMGLGVKFDRLLAVILAFIINYACYFSEIYRAGIQGVPHGQTEAGEVLGLTRSQIFFRVTLIQMIKRIVPPMSNEIITLVKDTSLSRIIALQEIIWAGQAFLKGTQGISGAIWPLFFTGIYYLIFNGVLTLLFGYIEKKLDYFKV